MTKIEHANSGQMIWQLDEINSAGLLNKFTLGDGNSATMSHTPERLLNVKSTPAVQVYDYNFDPQNGNLLARKLSIGNNVKEEVFAYDNLERLEQQRFDEIPPLPVSPTPLNISYDPQGKILSKTDAGLDYRYNMNAQLKKIQQHQAAISLNEQNITYTPFRTVNTIEENGIELTYTYGPDQSRYKGIWKNNGTQYRKRIYASGYEINEETVNGVTTTQNISYVSSPSGLCALYVEENGSGTFYFVHTDHLGSITAVTNANGNIIARQNFDAWGRRRKVQDYSYLPQNTSSIDNGLNNNGTLPKWLYRGYTGHEHLDEFALINMNARLYDPVVGMFLSPDNYIQAPGNTQNYNRYAYCLNNPLKYSDPSGNITYAAMAGFIHGFTSTSEGRFKAGFMEAGRRVENSLKIWNGLVTYNTHYSGKGDLFRDAGEIYSRFTWQLPQTIGGFLTAHSYNIFGLGGGVESVDYSYGATVVKTRGNWGAVAQSSYIVGDSGIEADPNNPLFQHEYGHYLQSQEMGVAYYIRVGIPSSLSVGDHDFHPVEQDANRRAFLYFNKNVSDFQDDLELYNKNYVDNRGWDFERNPFADGVGESRIVNIGIYSYNVNYVDYKNSAHISSLDKVKVHARWYDYVFPIFSGFYNAYQYNR